MARTCNAALGAKTRFHVPILWGCCTGASLHRIVRPALTSVLLAEWRSQALGSAFGSALGLGMLPWAWRESAKLRKNLHQIVLPAMAVQVL